MMSHLTADGTMLAALTRLMEPVEVRDPQGHIIGHYTPVVPPDKARMYEKVKGLFDLEEAERSAADPHPGYTTAQVLEHLRTLERQE